MLRPYFSTPILMYHKVGAPTACRQDRFLNVTAEGFHRQIRALARLGYTARPLSEVVESLFCGRVLPPRTFAVTFDDGFTSVGEVAAPILAEFGFPATVFAVSTGIGASSYWETAPGMACLPLLGREALGGLIAAGWEVGGHTRTHPQLDMLEEGAALAEIRLGKEEVEAILGVALRTFCYPFGYFNARTPELVRRAGFLGACTARSGLANRAHHPFLLPRVKIAYRDGLLGLLFRLLVRPNLPNTRPFRRSYRSRVPA